MNSMNKQPRIATLLVLLTAVCYSATTGAAGAAEVSAEANRDERMQWWEEARLGMFVHWGLYSGLAGDWQGRAVGDRGGMEWIQQRVRADTDAYAKAAIPLFKPEANFAKSWAKLAKQAGCKYLVFTTKHHDGFALHDSKVSDYDAGSVLQRDLVREIVDACREQGLRVGFYHSVIDWHHDQYAYAKSKLLPHPLKGKPYPNGERDHSKYVDFLHAQVDELIGNYGPVDIIWWDYSALDFQGKEAWRAFDLIDKVREKHPQVIMNNRLFRRPDAGYESMQMDGITGRLDPKFGDFITPEQHVPDEGLPTVYWETCMTMNTTWGFNRHDHAWKSSEQLIRTLIDITSKGGNFLLNIGPTADGAVPPESIERMQTLGKWLQANGEAIYGTSASPIGKLAWGRATQKAGDKKLYLHVFDWPADGVLKVAGLKGQVKQARLLASGVQLEVQHEGDAVQIKLTGTPPDPIATVIECQL